MKALSGRLIVGAAIACVVDDNVGHERSDVKRVTYLSCSSRLFQRPRMIEAKPELSVTLLILVVDDEPDVELLFRQQFRHDLRARRFAMEFAQSGDMALQRIADAAGVSLILILSDINMPGMSGLETGAQGEGCAARCSGHNDHCLWRCRHQAQGAGKRRGGAFYQTHRLLAASQRDRHASRTGRVTARPLLANVAGVAAGE